MSDMQATDDKARLVEILREAERVGVISHYRPDGDAIGSTLALGLALRSLGKRITMWNEDGVPERYAFLEGSNLVQCPPRSGPVEIDLLVCVDCGDPKRLGEAGMALLHTVPASANIDHHETNTRYAGTNYIVGGAASCSSVLVPVIDALGIPMSPAVAQALYVGLSTDTGSFQYGSTTAEDMRLAARLIECGVDVGDTNRRVYQEQPAGAFAVHREVLNNMVIEEDGQLVHYSMPAGKCAELGVGREETKDLVDIIRILRGARIAIIFEDLENGLIRVSLRSKDPRISVSMLAAQFGGGGHAMAAGIRMRGSLANCRESVLRAARENLKKLHE